MFKNLFSIKKAVNDFDVESAQPNPNKNLQNKLLIKIFVLGFLKGFVRTFVIGAAIITFLFAVPALILRVINHKN